MGFTLVQKNDFSYLKIDEYEEYGVEAYFTLKNVKDKIISNYNIKNIDMYNKNYKNINILFTNLNIDINNLYMVNQMHSDIAIYRNKGKSIPELIDTLETADAIVTDSDITLITFHADCYPVYFFDRSKQVLALIHCGWKGTYNELVIKTFDLMEDKFKSRGCDIIASIGPGICEKCFEVKEDVGWLFLDRFGSDIINYSNNKMYVDLKKAIIISLQKIGVNDIISSNYCTFENEGLFYSYRRGEIEERMIAILRKVK